MEKFDYHGWFLGLIILSIIGGIIGDVYFFNDDKKPEEMVIVNKKVIVKEKFNSDIDDLNINDDVNYDLNDINRKKRHFIHKNRNYKCTDDKGNIEYSDTCDGVNINEIDSNYSVIGTKLRSSEINELNNVKIREHNRKFKASVKNKNGVFDKNNKEHKCDNAMKNLRIVRDRMREGYRAEWSDYWHDKQRYWTKERDIHCN